MKTLRISEMPEKERPREKCAMLGPEKLSDAELLALVLRTGAQNLSALTLAQEILGGEGLSKLYHLSEKDLLAIRGIGRAKASQLIAVFELSIRLSKLEFREKLSYRSPMPSPDTIWSNSVLTVRNI